ncbi:hypothetical protein R1flu_020215 [Riccia fluitans]|uniref:Nitroreductase domain-containing protein n=1 Tax=Riccia fluitans TaxID=41844 RepID=A0ABD1ZM14_9MARC
MGSLCRAWRNPIYGSLSQRHRGSTTIIERPTRAASVRMMASGPPIPPTESPVTQETAVDTLLSYHQETKHSFKKFARGPRGLDWANQPNPFRRYVGASIVNLEHFAEETGSVPYPEVGSGRVQAQPLTKSSLSQLLYDSLSLSAWKSIGTSTWSLRVNPSSGNLHPTEGYVISGPVSGVSDSPFIAHYAPKEHALEIRAEFSTEVWEKVKEGLPEGSLLVGFTSVYWREAWKYGERAFRYCNHDVGHAIGAVTVASAHLGWNSQLVDGYGTKELHHMMGLASPSSVPVTPTAARAVPSSSGILNKGVFPDLEKENADCILAVFPWLAEPLIGISELPVIDAETLISHSSQFEFLGHANKLSKEHVRWDRIYTASSASHKPHRRASVPSFGFGCRPVPEIFMNAALYEDYTVRQVVRKRRSAVDMDGKYGMQRNIFYQLLLKATVGTPGMFPYGALPWDTEIHCAIFVHRVVDLPQGLYFLMRNAAHEQSLKQACSEKFHWEKPEGCPPALPLYRLLTGDARILAARLSCNQDIAGNSFFSLGMISRFQPVLEEKGPWMYPRLFWEAGLLGHVLYLEATAMGVSATGIGCYFDDAVHELLGLEDKDYQSLYHFTVGITCVHRGNGGRKNVETEAQASQNEIKTKIKMSQVLKQVRLQLRNTQKSVGEEGFRHIEQVRYSDVHQAFSVGITPMKAPHQKLPARCCCICAFWLLI